MAGRPRYCGEIEVNEYQAFVNDMPADPASFMFHHQDLPFPGGMRYRIHIGDREAVESLRHKYPNGVYDHLGNGHASFILDYVNLCLSLRELGGRTTRFNRVAEAPKARDSITRCEAPGWERTPRTRRPERRGCRGMAGRRDPRRRELPPYHQTRHIRSPRVAVSPRLSASPHRPFMTGLPTAAGGTRME